MTSFAPGGEIWARPVPVITMRGGQHLIDAHASGPAHDQTRPVVSWTVAHGPVVSRPVVSDSDSDSVSVRNGGASNRGPPKWAGGRPERGCPGGRKPPGGGGGRDHNRNR